MPNRLTTFVDASTYATAAVLNGEFDNIYTGTVDRTGGRFGSNSDVPFSFGTAQQAEILYSSQIGSLTIGVDVTSRRLLICDEHETAEPFGIPASSHPAVTVHSANTTTAQYIEMLHNATYGVINAGVGGVQIQSVGVAKLTVGTNVQVDDGAGLTFKDTDVAHGMTSLVETDVYGYAHVHDSSGALQFQGFGEGNYGLVLTGDTATTDTDKTTAATAAVMIQARLKTGTTVADVSADGNLAIIRNGNSTAQFIFDAEGSAHANVEWTTFDKYDDIALIYSLESNLTQGFGKFLTYNRKAIERAGIARFDPKHKGKAMINLTRLAMLLCGAARQSAARITALERRLLEA